MLLGDGGAGATRTGQDEEAAAAAGNVVEAEVIAFSGWREGVGV